jgi:hypothetical protein
MILHVVLYLYETLFLTLREDHKVRVFEDGILRRIFGPKRDEIILVWTKFHNGELHDLYSSLDIIRIMKTRMMRCGGHVARKEKKKECTQGIGAKERTTRKF